MADTPGQQLEPRTPAQQLVSRVRSDQFKQEIALALPPDVPPERFIRATATALLQNPEIANLEPASIFQSLLRAAQDGLLPDGREAALAPKGGKAVYMPMIGGFQKIAAEHGWLIRSRVVYANDEFDYTEEPPELTHRPVRPGMDRGDLVACYAVAVHRDGRRLQVVLHAADVAKRRAMATTDNVWRTWTEAMWQKSAGRAIFKQLPLADSDRVGRVLAASELEPGEAATMLYGPHGAVQARELTPAREAPGDGGAPAGQQAGEPADRAAADAGSPAPDPEPEPEPEPEPGLPPAAADAVSEAGAARLTGGQHKGLTIAEVAGKGDEGLTWIKWALRRSPFGQEFQRQLEVFVEGSMPETWAWFTAWREEQAA